MTTLIVMTADVADQVRGLSATVADASLDPVALTDGRFVLNVAVLTDPAHVAHHDLLAAQPTADLTDLAALMPSTLS